MSAYNSESALARLLRPHYSRSEHEGRALLREAFTLPGDLQIVGTATARPPRPRLSTTTQPSPPSPLHRTQRHPNPLPRHRPDTGLQRQSSTPVPVKSLEVVYG